jgi:hypothetical protein
VEVEIERRADAEEHLCDSLAAERPHIDRAAMVVVAM